MDKSAVVGLLKRPWVGFVAIIAAILLGASIRHPAVNYAATRPGLAGPQVAFAAELLMAFGLMSVVLIASNTQRVARFTGLFAAVLAATYISLESPLSGMSMNPARSFGSALPPRLWASLGCISRLRL